MFGSAENSGILFQVAINSSAGEKSPSRTLIIVEPTWLRSVPLSDSLNRTCPPFPTSESSQNGAIKIDVDSGKGRDMKSKKESLKDKTPFVETCIIIKIIVTIITPSYTALFSLAIARFGMDGPACHKTASLTNRISSSTP